MGNGLIGLVHKCVEIKKKNGESERWGGGGFWRGMEGGRSVGKWINHSLME